MTEFKPILFTVFTYFRWKVLCIVKQLKTTFPLKTQLLQVKRGTRSKKEVPEQEAGPEQRPKRCWSVWSLSWL